MNGNKRGRWWIFVNVFKIKSAGMLTYLILIILLKNMIEKCMIKNRTSFDFTIYAILIISIFYCGFHYSRGYILDLIVNKILIVEGKIITNKIIYAPGRGSSTRIGEKITIETSEGKRVKIDLFDNIKKECHKKQLWKSGVEYKAVYHCLRFSKVVLDIEYRAVK